MLPREIITTIQLFVLAALIYTCPACVTIATPAPMATMGGPKTTPKSTSETAIAIGMAGALFPNAHAGANGYFLRYKHGLSDKLDLGIDWVGAKRNSGLSISAKIAARYQTTPSQRLEVGFGAGDDSSGKSLNGDIAYTFGTIKDKTWNYYTSLRVGYAHGYPGDVAFSSNTSDPSDKEIPPNTFIGLINVGAQASITTQQKFIFEGGYGRIYPQGKESGIAFYVSAGLLFNF